MEGDAMASLVKKTNSGHEYWYIVESRRINGKPTPVVVQYLGSIANILSHYSAGGTEGLEYQSHAHGAVSALVRIAEKTGLLGILKEHLPGQERDGLQRGESLLLAAIHRAVNPGSKRSFSKWAKTTTLPTLMRFEADELTSQHFWDQMDGIGAQELAACEDAITRRVFELYDFKVEKLLLDYTNYYTYLATSNDRNTLAKRGHSKQKRSDLRQYSLAVVTTKDVLFPMCSHVYEGDHADHMEFPVYLDLLKTRIPGFDAGSTTLVYDGGSNTWDNLKSLKEMGLHYVCAFSLYRCKELYDIPLEDYERRTVHGREVLCHRLRRDVWGAEREILLQYSPKLFEGQMRELESDLAENDARLRELRERLRAGRSKAGRDRDTAKERVAKEIRGIHQHDLFEIEFEGNPVVTDFSWKVNPERKAEVVRKYFGKKMLITDHQDWSTEEIVGTYGDQYVVERIFKDTKNPHHFAIRPQYHWTDGRMRVHVFCCLLGLVLTSLLRKEMEVRGISLENDALMEELGRIRECWVFEPSKKNKSGLTVSRHLERMSPLQQELWNVVSSIE